MKARVASLLLLAFAGCGDGVPEADDSITPGTFSFFVASLVALQELSGSADGFGGDLSYGESGAGAGLRGADRICAAIAERSSEGSSSKGWRAFLSVSADENGDPVDAIDRIGEGPWYDRVGRLLAPDLDSLVNERPLGGNSVIQNDLPNEYGVPNHQPDPTLPEQDNHHMITGSNENGRLYSASSTCANWTSAASSGGPRCGFSWPRASRQGPSGGGLSSHWISGINAPGCAPGVSVSDNGGGHRGDDTVGSGGGYGGFYCFALEP